MASCHTRLEQAGLDATRRERRVRQINQSGYLHNRLRMVAASFLVKDLHVDWRWGERYFAAHLNDFDLAANNGDGSGPHPQAATRSLTSAFSTR
jgi:hypothetical protein